jgi:hypothetical protein
MTPPNPTKKPVPSAFGVAGRDFKTGRAGQPPAWKVRFLRRRDLALGIDESRCTIPAPGRRAEWRLLLRCRRRKPCRRC